jgi:antirestriction protein ArdC
MLNMKNDVFQQIADGIAAQLEQGVRPWAKPWREGMARPDNWPRNIRGRSYRGANVFWLQLRQQQQGYEAAVWLTFKQALEQGGCVRKGERGTPVFFWKFEDKRDPKTGKVKRTCWAKTYTVFNVAQCDGVTVPERKLAPMQERVAAADDLIEATNAVINYGGNKAFYVPTFDQIQMPPREAFKSADDLYGTLFHELGHWTGHASRLDRTLQNKFGDSGYAFEELVAELTAAFVCGSQGFYAAPRDDHAAYIGSWLKAIKDDPRAFVTAASKAQKAADFLLAFADSAEAELEPEDVQQAA